VSCERARADLSLAADGELPAERSGPLTAHVQACASCAAFRSRLSTIRQGLRFEAVGEVPDVAPRVLATVAACGPRRPAGAARRWPRPGRRRGPLRAVAAAFLAGAVLGATFVGLGGWRPAPVASADLPDRVLAAQPAITSLAADLQLVERGWNPRVPERVFTGRLRYQAPESLDLRLLDRTAYPSADWVRDDLELVVTGERWWMRARRVCPPEAEPRCAPRQPETRLVTDREPFADATPVPLDLITPVRSFMLGGAPMRLETSRIAGRRAIGVATTVAQVEPLLAGFDPAGGLRALYPADRAELWLDERALVPLALRVVAAGTPERARWAAAHGYRDAPGTVLLDLALRRVVLNRPLPADAFPAAPAGARAQAAGFAPAPSGAPWAPGPAPAWLPPGFRPYRAGVVATPQGPVVAVRTWTDGRAWVKVRATRNWPGGRLFGDLGVLVRPVELPGGTGYSSEDGTRVGIHGQGVDVLVTGSLAPADLERVAGSLAVAGRPVPSGWAEAATATPEQALAAAPGLLMPKRLRGFGTPAVRVDGTAVSLAFAGPGARGFLLAEAPGTRLSPPIDADVQGVRVRGANGRYSLARGELEWVEGGRVVSLRSTTLSLEELLAIAQSLAGR
jgi:hypothetical protein